MALELSKEEELAVEEMRAAEVDPRKVIDHVQKAGADENDPDAVVTRSEAEKMVQNSQRQADQQRAAQQHRDAIKSTIQAEVEKVAQFKGERGVLEDVVEETVREIQKEGNTAQLTTAQLHEKLRTHAGNFTKRKAEKLGLAKADAAGKTADADHDAEADELDTRLEAHRRLAGSGDSAERTGAGNTEGVSTPAEVKFGVHGRSGDNRTGTKALSTEEIQERRDQRFAAWQKDKQKR